MTTAINTANPRTKLMRFMLSLPSSGAAGFHSRRPFHDLYPSAASLGLTTLRAIRVASPGLEGGLVAVLPFTLSPLTTQRLQHTLVRGVGASLNCSIYYKNILSSHSEAFRGQARELRRAPLK